MKRDFRYDIMKAVAIVLVVMVHCLPAVLGSDLETSHHLLTQCVNVCISVCVPLFIIVSGALLLGRQETISYVLRHRLRRILVPFLVWSAIVYVSYKLTHEDVTLLKCVTGYFRDLVNMNIHEVYWFVYMIFGLYVILPLLRIMVKAGKSVFNYLSLLVSCAMVFGACFPEATFVSWWYNRYIIWLFMFLAGYWIVSRSNVNWLFRLVSVIMFLVLGAICLAIEVKDLSGGAFELVKVAFYLSTFCAMWSIFPVRCSSRVFSCVITGLSKYCYGIYLSHILFVSIYFRLISQLMMPIWLMALCLVTLVLATTMLLLHILNKIGLGKITT